MDDMNDDARYHPKFYSANQHNSSHRRKAHSRNAPYSRPAPARYEEVDDDDEEEEEETELHEFDNGSSRQAHEEEEEEEDDDVTPRGPNRSFHAEPDFLRHPKKRKLKTLESSYEFAPRARALAPPPPPASAAPPPQQHYRAARGNEEWSEHAVFVLLEVWGDRFLQLGRKSLRSEDWQEVAHKVSEASKMERSELQCRAMLDVLKRKFKKEKAKMEQGLGSSKWAYFKKMEMLMASSLRQECGLACGVDSGEYVFMNTRVYLERSNGFDEMRDSPGESETDGGDDEEEEEDDEDEEDDDVMDAEEGSSYRVLADSIHKFGQIYEKIETSKRQQMKELEKMRKDFNKELELQKKQILERAQAEIARLQESDDEETDVSVEDLSD